MIKNLILEIEKILKKYHTKACVSMVPDQMEGHIATNVLLLDKSCEQKVKEELGLYVDQFQIVDGFLNMILKPDVLNNMTFDYDFGKNEKICLEYCSPNPTGPLHLGHLRGIVVGKTMDSILRFCNYNITSHIYINDCGNQIRDFINTIAHWKDMEATGHSSHEVKYKGEYMKELARNYSLDEVLQKQINSIIDRLKSINVEYDVIKYESSLDMGKTMDLLKEKNLVTEKDGKLSIEDKVLRREDGTYTYFAGDIAYHLFKSNNGELKNQLIVLGEDQRGNFSHLQKLLLNFDIKLHIILIGTVFVRGEEGDDQKLSKRSGNIITIDDLLEKMCLGQLFCSLLDANLHKSIAINVNQTSLNNTRFYMEYLINLLPQVKVHNNPLNFEENRLMGQMLFWPKVLKDSIIFYDPHRFFVFVKLICTEIYNYFSSTNQIAKPIYDLATIILENSNDLINN